MLTHNVTTNFNYLENDVLFSIDFKRSNNIKIKDEDKIFYGSNEEWLNSKKIDKILPVMDNKKWLINDAFLKNNLYQFFIQEYRNNFNKRPFVIKIGEPIKKPIISDEDILKKLVSINEIHSFS